MIFPLEQLVQFDENIYDLLTDDASVFEKMNYPVKIVEGNTKNIKLTNPEDFNNL